MSKNKDMTKHNDGKGSKSIFLLAMRAKKPLFTGTLLSLLSIVCDIIGPYVVAGILDNQIKLPGENADLSAMLGMLAIYVTSVLLSAILRFFGQKQSQYAANYIAMSVQRDVFRHVQKLPVSYFDNLPAGKVVSRITNDSKALKGFYQVAFSQMLMAIFYGIGIFISLSFVDLTLVAIAAASFPALYFLFRDFKRKFKKNSDDIRRGISELNAGFNENIQGMEVIQAFNSETKAYDELNKTSEFVFAAGLNSTQLEAYNGHNGTNLVNYLLITVALFYYGVASFTGAKIMPIGHLYIFFNYMIQFFSHVNNLMQRIGDMEKSRSAAEHIFELMELPTVDDHGEDVNDIKGDIIFQNVSFYYKDENYVLEDVNFQIHQGDTVAFVGHTGAGKSTLMNLIFKFYKPQKGNIYIDGKDIWQLETTSMRSFMAIVTQEPYIFAGTLKSNINLHKEHITEAMAIKALKDVGGAFLLERLKDGINTKVKNGGHEFSSGERQIISFARALAQDPRILILDEATSHVDTETEAIIQKGISYISKGRTTILIAHRLSTIKNAKNIYVLDKGRIVESGTNDVLIEQNGIYAEMVRAQSLTNQQEIS